MSHTTPEKVKAVIQVDESISLDQFITTSDALTTHIVSRDTEELLTPELRTEIATYLAAHFYALYDPQYQQTKEGKAESIFQGQTGKMLELTWWGQQAILLDITGQLANISKGRVRASISWLGTLPENQPSDYA